jgi:hypothetical protein
MARPLAQIIEQAAAPTRDPIFAAINQYCRAYTTFGASAEALFATVPTTRAGCQALVNFILDEAGGMARRAAGTLTASTC